MKSRRLIFTGYLIVATLSLINLSPTTVTADSWQPITAKPQETVPDKHAQNEDPSLP